MAARHNKEGHNRRKQSIHVFPCVQRSNDRRRRGGCRGTPLFQDIRPGAGLETGDFDTEKLGEGLLLLKDS